MPSRFICFGPKKKKGGGETVLKGLIHEELQTLQERLDHLEPKECLEVLVKLLPYVLPKVSPAPTPPMGH